jgi:hypothetical protein
MYGTGPPPQIRFQRINPTRYLVQVRNAESPFMLVFADRYSPEWKLYQASDRSDDIVPVMSYLDGEVVEGAEETIFLTPRMMETWVKSSLSEDFHLKVNGYANGWYLTNVGNYDLIVEYRPQRLFHLGLMITALSAVSAVGYLAVTGVSGLRRRR